MSGRNGDRGFRSEPGTIAILGAGLLAALLVRTGMRLGFRRPTDHSR
jgi:hypothetical protein